jgi:hypothetical protein
MATLPNAVIEAVAQAGVTVRYADRRTITRWNKDIVEPDIRRSCGWYWWHDAKNRRGPYTTEVAAHREAYEALMLWLPASINHRRVDRPLPLWRKYRHM